MTPALTPGLMRQVALEADEAVGRGLEDALAGRRHAPGRRAGQPDADADRFGAIEVGELQAHAEGRTLRRQRVPGDPIEKFPQFRRERAARR